MSDIMNMLMDNKTLVSIFALFFVVMVTSSMTIGHLNEMSETEHQKKAKNPAVFNLLVAIFGMLGIAGYLYKFGAKSVKQFIY